MGADVTDYFIHSREQSLIVQRGFANHDAVLTKLPSVPDQPGSMRQGADWNGPVISGHTSEAITSNERSRGSEICGPQRGNHACWTTANYQNIYHLRL